MNMIFMMCMAALAAGCACLLYFYSEKRKETIPWIFLYLTVVLPFAAGGYYTYTAAVSCVLLMGNLLVLCKTNNGLRFCGNLNSMAVSLVVLGYCVVPLWAADRGMAVTGIIRYLPIGLYMLTLMQYLPEQRNEALIFVPLSGALMVMLNCACLIIPELKEYVTIKDRLSGFMQYPNTFAAFLLAGLILQETKVVRCKWDLIVDGILILGIIFSGSQTGFVLLLVTLLGILLIRKNKKQMVAMGLLLTLGLLAAVAVSGSDLLKNAARFTSISISSKSFLLRILYYKDALGVILKNPFGLGYMGFRAMEGSFQTGNYSTAFVHNGLLQLLLDIGWVPSILLATAFLQTIFARKTNNGTRLLLIVMLGHCMLDFNLQFLVIWVIVLSILDFETGKNFVICPSRMLGGAVCGILAVFCLWLGAGDLLYQTGNISACLTVTPFHTDALTAALTYAESTEEADGYAERILALNSSSSLAYSAKANTALSQGKVLDMMKYKENAIACARYTEAEYCDYFDKLYAVMQIYSQSGDTSSAAYCRDKLIRIPEMMEAVNASTSSVALRFDSDSLLKLPEEYLAVLQVLSESK